MALGLASLSTFAPEARAQIIDMRWEALAPDEKAIIDLLAADFYEKSLRQSQAIAIEAHTSELYAAATPAERAHFRAERRASWEEMTAQERSALHDVKRPSYKNLADEQKAPFRSIALNKLKAAGAIDEDALAEALRNDI